MKIRESSSLFLGTIYVIINILMEIVWIFREMRSGSTAFTTDIALHLNRIQLILEPSSKYRYLFQIPDPEKYVFSTHSFFLLNKMNSYKNNKPILLRCSRKDKLEQVLSRIFLQKINVGNTSNTRFTNIMSNQTDTVDVLKLTKPFKVSFDEVYTCLQNHKMDDYYWNTISSGYRNQTVYYEELCESSVDIPMLGITNLNLSSTSSTQKLPEYKKEMIINYDEVVQWVADISNEQIDSIIINEYLKIDNIKLEYFR